MADGVIFQTITRTEKLLAQLIANNQQVYFSFDPEDKEHSLLYSKQLEKIVDQLRESFKDFKYSPSTTALCVIELNALGIDKEEVSKKVFRQFFNQLVQKFISDKLGDRYKYINQEFPRFRENLEQNQESVVSDQDKEVVDAWENKIISDFDKQAKINGSPEEGKDTQQQEEPSEKPSTPVATSAGFGGFGGSNSRVKQAKARVDKDREQIQTDTTPTPQGSQQLSAFQLQKTILQESWRIASNPLLFDQALNTAMGVSNWRTYYDKLSSDQQREFDFQMESFQEKLAGTISQYLLADNQKASSFITSLQELGHAAVEKRTLKLEEFKGQIQEVVFKTLSNPYAAISVEQIKVVCDLDAYTDSSYKRPQQVADETAQAVGKTLDTPEKAQEVYAKGQSDQFKQQLKQIAILTAASSPDSIEQFAEQLMEFYPQIRKGGAGALTREIFDELLPQKAFSVGEDDRQALFKKVGLQLEEMALREAGLSAQNAQNIARALQYQRSNPRAALANILKQKGIDVVSEINLNHLLSKYALSLGSPHLLERDLGDFLAAIHPNLRDDKEVLAILRSYVNDHKQALADYTNNQLLTYSVNPEGNETVAATTATYNNLYDTYVQIYGDDTEAILAQALYNQNLENELEIENERELYRRQQALLIRQQYVQQIEAQLAAMDNEALWEQAADLGLSIPPDQERDQTLAQVSQAMNGQQPWMAPQVPQGEGRVRGLSRLKDWLNPKPGVSGVQNTALNAVTETGKKTLKEILKKAAVPVAGAGLGLAAYGIISNMLQGIVGTTLGGAVGGAAGGAIFGGAIGSVVPIIGTGFGALIGGIIGGFLGFLKGFGDSLSAGGAAAPSVASNASQVASAASKAAKGALDGLTQSAAAPAKAALSKTLGTITTSGVPIAVNTTTTVAVATPLVAVTTLSLLTTTAIFSAFLPDASTTQVAPYYSTDIEESRYITVKKIPSPTNAQEPQKIHYRIEITKKPDVPETIIITDVTEAMSTIDKDLNTVVPPDIPQSVLDQLITLKGKTVEKEAAISLEFDIDASDSRFNNSLVKNDIKVSFTANDSAEEANARAQTCFGDCPKTQVADCWPIDGHISQLPPFTGPKSNPTPLKCIPDDNGRPIIGTHCGGLGPNYKPDAYDIGTNPPGLGGEVPIYAAAPGTVVHSSQNEEEKYGYYVKIDHGTYQTMYLHMAAASTKQVGDTVEGGEEIGLVGGSGGVKDWFVHLHYEVTGLNEYALYSSLNGEYSQNTKDIGIVCNEYYGR